MPDVTLTLAAEDQASGILDRIVNSVEDLTSAVGEQMGAYSEFQREIIQKQEAASQAVRERVDNEKKIFDSIKDILDKTERLYRDHAQAMGAITEKIRMQGETHEQKRSYQEQVAADKMSIKQLEDNVKKESDIRKSDLEDKKDKHDENKHIRRMAYQQQITDDRARLRQLGGTNRTEVAMREGLQATQEHLITEEGHMRRMEYQRQVARDERSLKRLTNTIKEEETKRKRSFDNRKNTIDKEKHLRRSEFQTQVTSDKKEIKQLENTIKEKDHERRKDLENIRQAGRKEMQLLREQERERNRIMQKSRGGRGATDVMKGILYADFLGFGIHEIRSVANEILQATIKIQGMVFGLQAVEGSAERAATQLNRIVDIAKLPGIQLEPAIKATVTLRALKLEAELVERTIKAIGNALATLGREGELGGVVLALSQIVGKGKIHAEEINQIAERLPLIRGILVEEFGTANTEVLQKMELEIEDFVERITQGLERLPKVATQIGTSFKNLQNQIFLFTAQIGTYFKEELMDVIDWVTDRLEGANAALKFVNKRNEELARQQKVIEEAQAITVDTDVARGVSEEISRAAQRVQDIYSRLDPEDRQRQANRARDEQYEMVGADTEFKKKLADLMAGSYMNQFEEMAKVSESEKQRLLAELPQAEKDLMELMQAQKEATDALSSLSYEELKKKTLALDQAIRERTRILGLGEEGRMAEYRKELAKLREDVAGFNPVYRQFAYGEVMGKLAEKYILSPEQEQQMEKEMQAWRESLGELGEHSARIIEKHKNNLKDTADKAAKAAELELQVYNEKIAKLIEAEIVPELDPSTENKIRRVAESSDIAIGVESKILGLQDQFNATVAVGLESLLRSVDDQVERDMNKIARNIKPIAERLRPEIAALKTKAKREVEYDKVLADIRTQMESVAELHKEAITDYFNSLVDLEATFMQWLQDSRGAPQISSQLSSRIDNLVSSKMIEQGIDLQIEGIAQPFNMVREYAIDTLTRSITADTTKQLDKLREEVLDMAKATHPDFHTYTPERQTAIFQSLFEQRAPAIRESERVLIDITEARFNEVLDVHTRFREWYRETVGPESISDNLDDMVRRVTGRGEFGEIIRFRVEGFESQFQNERGRMIQGIVQRVQDDATKTMKDMAMRVHTALLTDESFRAKSPEVQTAEFNRVYNQLIAPIQAGVTRDIADVIGHFDKVIEVQTIYHDWLKNTAQTPFLSESQMSRVRKSLDTDAMSVAYDFQMAGLTEQFQDIKDSTLQGLVDSIKRDATEKIGAEAKNVENILMTTPGVLDMSRQELEDTISKLHKKRIEVINIGRDLAISNVEQEFENLSRQQLIFQQWLRETTGQSQMQRVVTEDVQKALRGTDAQKAFEGQSRWEFFAPNFDEIMDKELQKVLEGYDRETQIQLEKTMAGAGDVVRQRISPELDLLRGIFGEGAAGMFYQDQLNQYQQEQTTIAQAANELKKAQAEQIFAEELNREKEAHREKQINKNANDRIDVLADNRLREQVRNARQKYDRTVEDSALSAAQNIVSAWQQVSQQTDTMLDDVIGMVATITLQVTEMLLTIQRTSAAASAAGQTTGFLGDFAKYAGFAGIALGAAATVYSFVDSRDDDRQTRNNIKRSRPTKISYR